MQLICAIFMILALKSKHKIIQQLYASNKLDEGRRGFQEQRRGQQNHAYLPL